LLLYYCCCLPPGCWCWCWVGAVMRTINEVYELFREMIPFCYMEYIEWNVFCRYCEWVRRRPTQNHGAPPFLQEVLPKKSGRPLHVFVCVNWLSK
jgi:hypothetical protein